LFEQFGGALFESTAPSRRPAWKPAVEALEERKLMSIVVGGGIGGIGSRIGGTLPPGQPQPLSNMTSVIDYFGTTYFFQINADQTVSYNISSDPSGTWHNTGVQAISISAGTNATGDVVLGVIRPDQTIWLYNTGSAWASDGGWTSLGGKALSISVTQNRPNDPGQVYVIGTNYNLYVQDSETPHGWDFLGTGLLNGQHVSLETISALAYYFQSVCYATDSAGDVWQFTLQNPENLMVQGSSGGTWSYTGGTDAVQIAASFDGSGNPIVYALGYYQFNNVSVFDKGWTSLGGDAVEISAGRTGGPYHTSNIVYAIMDSHEVFVLNNSASPDWSNFNTSTGPTWQSLGGYATGITAEATWWYTNSGVFASNASYYAQVYNNGWNNLFGQQMSPSHEPLGY
jgi:hypothetical protein